MCLFIAIVILTQIPVLNLAKEGVTPVERISISSLTLDIVCKMRLPLIFKNLKTKFDSVISGSSDFLSRAKKQAVQSRKPLGRVTEPLSEAQQPLFHEVCTSLFKVDDSEVTDQILTAPMLPESLALPSISPALQPTNWAAGALHEATHFEAHLLGSIRVNFSGTKTFACVNFSSWSTFVRKRKEKKVEAPTGTDKKEWLSLGEVNTDITPVVVRHKFRNCTADSKAIFILLLLKYCLACIISI